MKKVRAVFFFVLSGLTFFSNAQDSLESNKAIIGYGVSVHQATILIHSKEVRSVSNSYPLGFQFELFWQKKDEESWNRCHCFPKLGLAVQLWDFDSPEILGNGMNTFFFIEPEYGGGRFFSFSFRGGFGASVLSSPHHETTNPDNQSYSTHLAFSLVVALKAGFRLSERTRIDVSPYYNHISNGGVKDPNKGINYPSITLGFSHYLDKPVFIDFAKKTWNRENRLKRYDLTPFVSWKQMDNDIHVFSPGLELKYSRQLAYINAITFGLEYLYDNFDQYRFNKNGVQGEWQKFSTAVGHEFLLGKLIFSQQLGFYLYNPDWAGDPFYQRYGLTYNFTKSLATGINMKAHRHVADLIDFRLVISFY